jgi:hypothetical protein
MPGLLIISLKLKSLLEYAACVYPPPQHRDADASFDTNASASCGLPKQVTDVMIPTQVCLISPKPTNKSRRALYIQTCRQLKQEDKRVSTW